MTKRYDFIDLSRGFIIALMALDHVRFFISKAHGSESWGVALPNYEGDAAAFLARWLTHLCAPGFFFLMGVSMALASESKLSQAIPAQKIRNHFIVRGLVLILLQISLINVAWLIGSLSAEVEVNRFGSGPTPGDSGEFWIYFGVLASLGCAMVILSVFLFLPNLLIGILGLGIITISFTLFPNQVSAATHFNILERLLWVPGQTDFLQVRYPIVPWVGVAMLGLIYGRLLKQDNRTPFYGALIGVCLLGIMLVLRGVFDWGDHHKLTNGFSWIDFLNFTKYPPSLAFLCVTLGINLILIKGFMLLSGGNSEENGSRLQNSILKPLRIFGSATLAFYFLHLYLYGLAGYLFPAGTTLFISLLFWLLGLGLLLPLCHYWRMYKSGRPAQSWVHLF